MPRVDVCVAAECPRGPVRCVMSCAGSPQGGEGRRPRSADGSVSRNIFEDGSQPATPETARSAMVGPAKCMVKLRCAWSRWRAGAMRQRHEALTVSLPHSRSVLAPAHLRGGTSSRVSHRVCGPRCRQVALLLGVCLVCAGSAWKLLEKAAYAVAGCRWLSPASLLLTPIVCPRP